MASIRQLTHANGLEYIHIISERCEARIYLQGAQVEYFKPAGQKPLIWMSSADEYQPGTGGLRGGIPICWPWFGDHANEAWPAHGFARNKVWRRTGTEVVDDTVTLKFTLPYNQFDHNYWPHHTELTLTVVLTDSLSVHLTNTNLDDHPVTFTQALHSYFAIEDIHQLHAYGFSQSQYVEFGEGPVAQQEDGVVIDKETDRVYTQLGPVQHLNTPAGTIEVSRRNSCSAILWNPWIDKAKRLSRFNNQDYLQMVCLEAANVGEDAVTLAPGESHTLTTNIAWQA